MLFNTKRAGLFSLPRRSFPNYIIKYINNNHLINGNECARQQTMLSFLASLLSAKTMRY